MKSTLKPLIQNASIIVTFAVLVSCSTSSVSVQSDYDHAVSFSQYHSYVLDSSMVRLNPANTAVLKDSLRSALAARGIKEESPGSADLYIVALVGAQQKSTAMPSGTVSYYRSGYGRYGFSPGVRMATGGTTYAEGTLILDFVDRKTHKAVFRGAGSGVISTPERNAAAIQSAVNKIVAQFPGG